MIGKDIPESGGIEEYSDYKFMQPIIYMCKFWKDKNYGKLSIVLENLYKHEENKKIRPKLCREQFSDKELITFKIKEVEDRAISLKRILVEVTFLCNDDIKIVNLEFGSIYQDKNGKAMIPEDDEGNWVLNPWNISGLYSL